MKQDAIIIGINAVAAILNGVASTMALVGGKALPGILHAIACAIFTAAAAVYAYNAGAMR